MSTYLKNICLFRSQGLEQAVNTEPLADNNSWVFGGLINVAPYSCFTCQKEEGTQTDNDQKDVATQTE